MKEEEKKPRLMDSVVGLPYVIAAIIGIGSFLAGNIGLYFRLQGSIDRLDYRVVQLGQDFTRIEMKTDRRFTSDNAKELEKSLIYRIDRNAIEIDKLDAKKVDK